MPEDIRYWRPSISSSLLLSLHNLTMRRRVQCSIPTDGTLQFVTLVWKLDSFSSKYLRLIIKNHLTYRKHFINICYLFSHLNLRFTGYDYFRIFSFYLKYYMLYFINQIKYNTLKLFRLVCWWHTSVIVIGY